MHYDMSHNKTVACHVIWERRALYDLALHPKRFYAEEVIYFLHLACRSQSAHTRNAETLPSCFLSDTILHVGLHALEPTSGSR